MVTVYNNTSMSFTRIRLLANDGLKSFVKGRRYFYSESSVGTLGSAARGLWSHLTDESARKELQVFARKNIINHDLLTQSVHGRVLMMALLHELRNPLFTKHSLDIGDFVENVAPALEVYHETLLQLMASATELSPDDTSKGEKEKEISESIKSPTVFDDDSGDRENVWRQEAAKDPHSLAAQFGKISTDDNFDEQYRSVQMVRLFHATGLHPPMNYVAESCDVEYLTLVNANAQEMDEELYKNNEHPEFAASDPKAQDSPVLARFQVLYNMTRKFRLSPVTPPPPTSASETYKSLHNMSEAAEPSKTPADATPADASENTKDEVPSDVLKNEKESVPVDDDSVYLDSRLGVAFFEGWLNGGPENALRWKVAAAKEAHEL
jgi:hypothetical protein